MKNAVFATLALVACACGGAPPAATIHTAAPVSRTAAQAPQAVAMDRDATPDEHRAKTSDHERPRATPPAPASAADDGHDFIEQAMSLYRTAACAAGAGAQDDRSIVRKSYIKRHCRALAGHLRKYRRRWLDRATPFFAGIVPDDIPRTVVYPFAGGDLITALAVFSELDELTTLSLEPAGDPRVIDELAGKELEAGIDQVRGNLGKFLAVNHSRTRDIQKVMARGPLPAHLIFSLTALVVHGYEPVSLRYFTITDDGDVRYLSLTELQSDATGAMAADQRNPQRARNRVFANMELRFRRAGDATAPVRVYRHIRADLSDDHLQHDDRVIRHLAAKGRVSAMTKAASYLLWWRSFSIVRQYLLEHIDWMISDASGIPPRFAAAAGFEQITWGWFHDPILKNPGPGITAQMRALWRRNPRKRLPITFGYLDRARNRSLMVTRRPGSTP